MSTSRYFPTTRSSVTAATTAMELLGIPSSGVRPVANAAETAGLRSLVTGTVASPSGLGDLEQVGYRYGAARTRAELEVLVALDWIDLDHWAYVQLVAAMRSAARLMNAPATDLRPAEARHLAHGASLGRIDALSAFIDRPVAVASTIRSATTAGHTSGSRVGFHGGC